MSDSKKAQIGLPEVRLGIFPAWGGCTRLPRVVGLAGRARPDPDGKVARRAAREEDRPRRRGRPGGDLRRLGAALRPGEARGEQARRARRGPRPLRRSASLERRRRSAARLIFAKAREGVIEADRRPLPGAARGPRGRSRRASASRSPAALEAEARHIGFVFGGEVQRNLLDIFFLTEEVKKETGVVGPGRAPARGDAGRRPRRRRHGRRHRAARRRQGAAGADEGHRARGARPRVRRGGRASGRRP